MMKTLSSNWTFVTVAYTLVWIALGGYWLYVHRTLARARRRWERAGSTRDGASR